MKRGINVHAAAQTPGAACSWNGQWTCGEVIGHKARDVCYLYDSSVHMSASGWVALKAMDAHLRGNPASDGSGLEGLQSWYWSSGATWGRVCRHPRATIYSPNNGNRRRDSAGISRTASHATRNQQLLRPAGDETMQQP